MTLQEVFDRNWHWFVEQRNPPGFNSDTQRCTYIGPPVNDLPCRCAIGCCLPENVNPPDDSSQVSALVKRDPLLFMLFGQMDRCQLRALQNLQFAHDQAAIGSKLFGYDFHQDYRERLLLWADDEGLEITGKQWARAA